MKTCRRCGQTDPSHPNACGIRVRKVEHSTGTTLLADKCGVVVDVDPTWRLNWERQEPEGHGGSIIRWVARVK